MFRVKHSRLFGFLTCNLSSTYCSNIHFGYFKFHALSGIYGRRHMKVLSETCNDFTSFTNMYEDSSTAVRVIHVNSDVYYTSEEKELSAYIPLYKNHIATNYFQKTVLSVGAAAAALINPRRHDMVAVLGETTGYMALSTVYTKMNQNHEGEQILIDKPRISSSTVDYKYLAQLPEESLGYFYIKFLNDNKVTPDSRLPVQFVDDPELAYVMQRYREVHDLFHTILGMPTNMLGEVAVKWVEAIQTGLPMCYGAAFFGPLRFRPKQRQKYLEVYLPWALKVGKSSKLLMNIYFEKRWEQSMAELRNELCIEPPEFV